MKKLIIAFVFLISVSFNCTMPTTSNDSIIKDIQDSLIYFQDNRGLCYAAIESFASGNRIISITNIPCQKGE